MRGRWDFRAHVVGFLALSSLHFDGLSTEFIVINDVRRERKTGLRIDAVVIPGDQAERVIYPDDAIWLRAVGHGELQVADYTSTDRDGPDRAGIDRSAL